jgi:hypothetical protein
MNAYESLFYTCTKQVGGPVTTPTQAAPLNGSSRRTAFGIKVLMSPSISEKVLNRKFARIQIQNILKLNDVIFYTFWEDYFHSLLIHNHFFPHLAFERCYHSLITFPFLIIPFLFRTS